MGLQGYGSMPGALSGLSTQERATYCNDHWAKAMPRLSTLEFTRDRKMMSTLVAGRRAPVLYVKVGRDVSPTWHGCTGGTAPEALSTEPPLARLTA